jgi:hypothetical protein
MGRLLLMMRMLWLLLQMLLWRLLLQMLLWRLLLQMLLQMLLWRLLLQVLLWRLLLQVLLWRRLLQVLLWLMMRMLLQLLMGMLLLLMSGVDPRQVLLLKIIGGNKRLTTPGAEVGPWVLTARMGRIWRPKSGWLLTLPRTSGRCRGLRPRRGAADVDSGTATGRRIRRESGVHVRAEADVVRRGSGRRRSAPGNNMTDQNGGPRNRRGTMGR